MQAATSGIAEGEKNSSGAKPLTESVNLEVLAECCMTCPICGMTCFMEFKHKGLRRFWESGDARGISGDLTARLNRRLDDLDAAATPDDLRIPGYRLHPLTGERAGYSSIRVSGNWRLVFRFRDGEAVDVDLVDYH